ncbi:hypothetical protein B0H17DRAFT_1148394 [Mycena rosella]|uniref:Uncharacterized protein n=1 Tax=Mycena rosella TaxID=1033263 RepID=A0AAD7CDI0_MYCRO|nr:hypothetical protein B0H17DRAFT_1148394 [Mycena rosella]
MYVAASYASLDQFATSLAASHPPALAFSVYGTHFLPAPASARRAGSHTYTNDHDLPFQSIIFGRVQKGVEGCALRIDCSEPVSEIVKELFELQLVQVSFAVQSEYLHDVLSDNQVPTVTAATDNPSWRTIGGTHIDVHVGHDNSDRCVFHEDHNSEITSIIPTLTQEWPIRPGQWIVAQMELSSIYGLPLFASPTVKITVFVEIPVSGAGAGGNAFSAHSPVFSSRAIISSAALKVHPVRHVWRSAPAARDPLVPTAFHKGRSLALDLSDNPAHVDRRGPLLAPFELREEVLPHRGSPLCPMELHKRAHENRDQYAGGNSSISFQHERRLAPALEEWHERRRLPYISGASHAKGSPAAGDGAARTYKLRTQAEHKMRANEDAQQ